MPLATELQWWHDEFVKFKRRTYRLIIVGFALILSGFVVIAVSYITGQHDVHRVSCANSQTLITQYEWFRRLTTQNAAGLSAAQVAEREKFYDQAEALAIERAGPTCATLPEMQAQAQKDIQKVRNGG